jgi:hypothetical protein
MVVRGGVPRPHTGTIHCPSMPPMPPGRQLRLRVLAALEERTKQFRTREAIYPLRVPRDPLLLDEVIVRTLAEEHAGFSAVALRSRTLITLEWEDVRWDAWVITLPSGVKLYCDSDAHETRVLASGGRNAGDESDRLFLRLLSESGGEEFGIEMSGGAPTRVRSSIDDREFLVEFFLNLFEITHTEDTVRRVLPLGGEALRSMEGELMELRGSDFKADVERWLGHVITR